MGLQFLFSLSFSYSFFILQIFHFQKNNNMGEQQFFLKWNGELFYGWVSTFWLISVCRFPKQYGFIVQTPAWWKELHRRKIQNVTQINLVRTITNIKNLRILGDIGLWWTNMQRWAKMPSEFWCTFVMQNIFLYLDSSQDGTFSV